MIKAISKKIFIATLLALFIIPSISYAQSIDLYLDVCNKYEGSSKINTIMEGVTSFMKENPQLDVNVKLFGYPIIGVNENRMLVGINKLNVKNISKVDSLYDELTEVDAEDSVKIIISGGKGEWGELKEMLRERDALKLNVVGVDMPNPDAMRTLNGVASASGGRYFNAKDGQKLNVALSNIEKMANYNLEVKVFKNRFEELTDYLMARYKYVWTSEVYESGKHDKPITSTYVFPARFNLESGVYDIKINYGNRVKWIEGVRVKRWALTEKLASFAEGLVNIRVFNSGHKVEGTDRRGRDCWWSEAYNTGKHDEAIETTKTFPPEFNLVNGEYDIKIHYRGFEQWINNVKVEGNKMANFEITFPHAKKCDEVAGS